MTQSLIWAAFGTGFAFLMTVSGAATVFLFRKQMNDCRLGLVVNHSGD